MDSSLDVFQALTKPKRRRTWRTIQSEIGRNDPNLLAAVEVALGDSVTPRAQVVLALQALGYDIAKMGVENWAADVVSR